MPEEWGSPESPERVGKEVEQKQLVEQKQQQHGGWKYELGRTLGEGNFGKVKYARHVESGRAFAIKILDKQRILSLKIDDQVRSTKLLGT